MAGGQRPNDRITIKKGLARMAARVFVWWVTAAGVPPLYTYAYICAASLDGRRFVGALPFARKAKEAALTNKEGRP